MTAELDQDASAERLHALASHGLLSAGALDAALEIAGLRPTAESWWNHARRSLLVVGGALCVVGVIFFIAANWQELGPPLRMGLVVTAMLGAAFVGMRAGLDRVSGRVACVVAGALVGPLFALFGQTYQTGADAWTLFAAWCALFIPFTVASRLSGAVVLWMVLLHLALGLWWDEMSFAVDEQVAQLLMLVVDGGLAAIFELGAARDVEGLRDRLAARVAVLVCGVGAVLPAASYMDPFLHDGGRHGTWLLVGFLVVGIVIGVYGVMKPDFSLLSAGALGVVVLVTAGLSSVVMHARWDLFGIFFIGTAVIAQVVVVTRLLRAWSRRHP